MAGHTNKTKDTFWLGLNKQDRLPLAFLLAAGLILAWPIISGGWLTYLDNPAHIAEIHSLANDDGDGWSELAWCGYPLGRLHSPVWFGGMAWLQGLGLPLGPMYLLCLLLGFFTPPVVIYLLARRWGTPPVAIGLTWLLMVQRTALVGFGTALGGMWTFYIAAGAVILLTNLLAKREACRGDLLGIAALYGFLGITHLFAIVPAMIVFGIHVVVQLVVGARWKYLLQQSGAAVLGALASASYWAPLALAGESVEILPLNLRPAHLMARLFLPIRMPDLVSDNLNLGGDLFFLEALPPVVLVLLGFGGLWVYRRSNPVSRLPLYGFLLAMVLLVLLLFVGILAEFEIYVTWLGHVSWRLLYFVRIGFALAALPLLEPLGKQVVKLVSSRKGWWLATAFLLFISFGFGLPLRRECLSPTSPQMDEVRQVWTWLETHRQPTWGRIYVQDPFHGGRDEGAGMANSHVMAMTAMNTGVDQVGPLYGGSPFPNVKWLLGESGRIFGRPLRNDHHLERLRAMLPLANVTGLVLHHPDLTAKLVGTNLFQKVFETENFSILFPLPATTSRWVDPFAGQLTVTGGPVTPGRWQMTVEAQQPGGSVLMKTSWSPHWRLDGPAGAEVAANNSGLVEVAGLPAGHSSLKVEFRPPRWPDWLSVAGWLVIGLAWFRGRRRGPGNRVDSTV